MSDTTPVSTTNSNAWAPSMPNSDLWTLKSARDAAQLISPKLRGNAPIPRRVVALPTSPLARLPPWTASISVVAAASVSAAAPAAAPSLQSFSAIPAFLQTLQQPHNRATIGLGHPSTSKRRSIVTATPLQSDSASASAASPQPQPSPHPRPCPRINSSTIKRRTERFPGRELHSIAEDPVPVPNQQQQACTSSHPVPGTRRRSYAQVASITEETTPKQCTGRRVTPTTPTTITNSSSSSSGSLRCAAKQTGGASVSSIIALAPRSTTAGAPQAGPTQVQSPRVLFPATMAGSPCFQSLDGAVLGITKALRKERERESESEVEETEKEEGEVIYGEDGFIKFKVHTQLRVRFAARRFKMLF